MIIIDPGHGGHNNGCFIGNVREADWTLSLAVMLQNKLKKMGITSQLTRYSDVNMALSGRGFVATNSGADLVISLHVNDEGAENPTLRGASIFIAPDNYCAEEYAESILENWPVKLKGNAKRIIETAPSGWKKHANNICTMAEDIDTLLIECGFCRTDTKHLLDNKVKADIVDSIAFGLI